MNYLISGFVLLTAYLIGSISSSVLISKKMSGADIRESGSGNAGATNMLRVHGKKAGVITLLCDLAKGIVAVLLAMAADFVIKSQIDPSSLGWFEANVLYGNLHYLAGVFVVLGHDFPIFFGFRGGKGVATSLGVMMILDWKIGLVVALIAILIMIASKYVSLGSVLGGVIYPVAILAYMIGKNDINWIYFSCALIIGLIIIAKHHSNIKRLMNGTENKLFAKKNNE